MKEFYNVYVTHYAGLDIPETETMTTVYATPEQKEELLSVLQETVGNSEDIITIEKV